MNKVILMGRLAKEPELKSTKTGKSVIRFSIAVEGFSQGKKKVDFINVIAWEKNAETVANYFHKGNTILIEGYITTGTREGTDGKKIYTTDITAARIFFCTNKNEQSASGNGEAFDAPMPDMGEDDDLPF